MIRIHQSTFGLGTDAVPAERGDCFSACIASVLEFALDLVPRFCESDEEDWGSAIDEWLRPWGLHYVEMLSCEYFETAIRPAAGYHVVTGHSPRNRNFRHCVVGYGCDLIFDPFGTDERGQWLLPHSDKLPWAYGFFIPLDPSKTPPAE